MAQKSTTATETEKTWYRKKVKVGGRAAWAAHEGNQVSNECWG